MCMRKECIEAREKARLKDDRGPSANISAGNPQPQPPSKQKYAYINASGGVTVSNKHKQGIIQ